MISMCGNCSAKVVSVMDGQRPQIRCEGRWRAPYKDDVRYVSALIRSIWSGEDQILTGVPPSMLMIWLVMNRDSSVARNRTRLATSIGYPGPSIICIISNMPSNA